jgi:AcrR family transcriptional regulator
MPKVSEEHKTKVKETIMKAAIKNFSKTGFAITKMDDIAKTADVSKGTLYLYFQSKEDLFESICKSNQQILIDKRSGLFQNKGRIKQDLGIFYDNFLKAVQDTRNIRIEALAESVHNPKMRKIIQKNRKEIELNVEEFLKGMRKGGFFQNNVDMNALSSGIIALFDGLFLSELIGTNHEDNKKAWIKTMMAIFEGTGM